MDNPLDKFMADATKGWPPEFAAGMESDWLLLGRLEVISRAFWFGDPRLTEATDGLTVTVPNGEYVVDARGMDFNGHRRVSRVRVFGEGAMPTTVAEHGKIAVDSGAVAVCDASELVTLFDQSLGEEVKRAICGVKMLGGTIAELKISPMTMRMALVFAGFGDGTYPLFLYRERKHVVGGEVEFI